MKENPSFVQNTNEEEILASVDTARRWRPMPSFLLEQVGGMERHVAKNLVPVMFRSQETVIPAVKALVDNMEENDMSVNDQLNLLRSFKSSIADMQLLEGDREVTYNHVQFAYDWVGKARDVWRLSQEDISNILSSIHYVFSHERFRKTLPYLTSVYMNPVYLLSGNSKIDRFMDNMTPQLLDAKNSIYHFNINSDKPIFLRLDTETKRKQVQEFLEKIRPQWEDMFQKNPTIKTYSQHELPKEFEDFKISLEKVKEYIPQAFSGDDLRENIKNTLHPVVRKTLSKDFGFDMAQLQQEQFFLIDYISNKTNKEMAPVKEFAQTYGADGLRTFLSLAHGGPDMGDKILEIAEQIPQETAQKIFSKYAELVEHVDEILDMTKTGFKQALDTQPQTLHDIQQTLYQRGVALLNNFHQDIESGQNIESLSQEIQQQLDRINADTVTTLAIFKHALRAGQEVPLSDITGATFSSAHPLEFSPEQQAEMKDIYETNWEHYPDSVFVRKIMDYFEGAFIDENSKANKLYTFQKDDHIQAFIRFEEKEPGIQYASALNVDENMQGLALGEAMMDEALKKESETSILKAVCDPMNRSNMRYFEMGFIAKNFTQDNPPLFEIEWNQQENVSYRTKQMTKQDLLHLPESDTTITIRSSSSLRDLHTEIPTGKVLTRCFQDPAGRGDWYAVYENRVTRSEEA